MAITSFKVDSTTLVLNGTTIDDFINGDIVELAPVNPETTRTYGRDRSVNIQERADKDVYTLKFRVMRNSDSDIFMNTQINGDSVVVFDGSIKEIFVKDSTEYTESFELLSGSVTDKPTHTRNNVDGNSTVEYTIECFARRLV